MCERFTSTALLTQKQATQLLTTAPPPHPSCNFFIFSLQSPLSSPSPFTVSPRTTKQGGVRKRVIKMGMLCSEMKPVRRHTSAYCVRLILRLRKSLNTTSLHYFNHISLRRLTSTATKNKAAVQRFGWQRASLQDKQVRHENNTKTKRGRLRSVSRGYCRERGTGTASEGADGGVTLREGSGRREGRKVAMPVYFFSGHKLVDFEKHT